MRKMQDGLIIILNETDGSSTVVKNILQGDSTLQLDHSITTQANFPLVVCRWVIRRMKTQLSDKDILEQIQNENNTRKASGAAECTIGRMVPLEEWCHYHLHSGQNFRGTSHSKQHPVGQETIDFRSIHPAKSPAVFPLPEALTHPCQLFE